MKKLELSDQELLVGGDFWNGFCGAALAAGFSLGHPVVATTLAASGVGTMVYAITIGANAGCFVAGYR